ncbi:MAG TPA: HNH endonuclease signature motif containing protein [Candidatus Nanoarchaeia archaeon]|nr:HNH endonuclease signature motif containing protein [Candidatus Nanoarchaeia archaeon]
MRFPPISSFENKKDSSGTLICRNCDELVSKGRRFYCSEMCLNEFTRNHTWDFVREDVLRRDNYRCGICNTRKRKALLDVDHIIPVRLGIDPFEKQNLRSLCKECHVAKTNLDRESILKPTS